MSGGRLTPAGFAAMFDHTLLAPYAARADFERVARECAENKFCMLAINSGMVAMCKHLLSGTGVHVGAAVGFPLGAQSTEAKLFETQDAVENGADEIDYVVNLSYVKEESLAVEYEMSKIVEFCRKKGIVSKVIFETCYLDRREIEYLCEMALEIGPDYVKTSTGFGSAGATLEHVSLMKSIVGDKIKVKASGGIRELDFCLSLIRAGAERIGSSRSVELLDAFRGKYGEEGAIL